VPVTVMTSSPASSSSSFLLLDARIQRWIWQAGWTELKDAQERAIPLILEGRRDVIIAAATAWFAISAWAQAPPQEQAHDHDAHHRDMLTRGAQAMGFDQERTVHHFLLYEDGGAIDVAVKEASDHASLHAVREHLQQIAGLFKDGDFGRPALTHAQQVPGTADMTQLKDGITYKYEETPLGGRVRIVTRDAAALAAVHAFLHFQIGDHQTEDSGVVQRPSECRNCL